MLDFVLFISKLQFYVLSVWQVAIDDTIKLADLGMAKAVDKVTGTVAGTPLYMAPEVWKEEEYTEKADIFGLGMIMWEVWYGTDIEQKFKVDNLEEFRLYPFLKDHIEPSGVWMDIMSDCWQDDPEERPSTYTCIQALQEYVCPINEEDQISTLWSN